MQAATATEIDQAVGDLVTARARFLELDTRARLEILGELRRDTHREAAAWVRSACELKGLDFEGPASAEEWLAGPVLTLRTIRLLERALRSDGAASSDHRVRVFPADVHDRLLYQGFRADVWLDSELAGSESKSGQGGTVLVLGAGNVACIATMDVLSKIFVEDRLCVLKMHPVNDVLAPHFERCFEGLVRRGFLRIVRGGADVGDALVRHEGVDEIHITGSEAVHDAIVWGTGEDARRAREAGTPRVAKPITSELGCVTPVLVVPGRWSPRELRFQAENLATMLANNASCNCNAAKLLVTCRGWGQRAEFLAALGEILESLPTRRAYYPGSATKYEAFVSAHPDAKRFGEASGDHLPWTLIDGLDPEADDEIAFHTEAWSPILAEAVIDAPDAAAFLERAVPFVNERVSGTLSCAVLVDPRSARSHADALERAIAELRYGTIAVNHWPALGFAFVTTPWGAYPGHTLESIGSGIGFVHNTAMLEGIVKCVLRGPFVVAPKPPWFVTHRQAHRVARKLLEHEASPSLWRIPGIAWTALRG